VDQRDHGRLALARESSKFGTSPRGEHLALDQRLQRREQEEKPKQAQQVDDELPLVMT
jgi:hypothetical protein